MTQEQAVPLTPRERAVSALDGLLETDTASELLDAIDAHYGAKAALAAWLDEWCGHCGFGRKYHPRGHEWTATGTYRALSENPR